MVPEFSVQSRADWKSVASIRREVISFSSSLMTLSRFAFSVCLGVLLLNQESVRGLCSTEVEILPGMPPIIDPSDIYSEDRPGKLSPAVKSFPSLVYVPNSGSNSVDVINPRTFRIIKHFAVGRQPQHVTPSYDLKRLWVLNDLGDSTTEIDPATGKMGKTIPVKDPYNMYYTPDGRFAIVVAEREMKLNFLNPETMKLVE